MADSANTLSTANGWAKDVFGKANTVLPEGTKLLRNVKFKKDKELGQLYSEPVWLTEEQGFTYDSGTGTDFTLNDAQAAEAQELQLSGSEIVLKSTTAMKVLSAAVGGGQKSFGKWSAARAMNMTRAFKRRLEMSMFWGGTSLGQLTYVSGTGTATQVFSFGSNNSTYAPGIWAGSKNAYVDLYNSTTKTNTNADVQISAFDPANKQLTLVGNATDLDAVTSGTDEIYWKGAYGNENNGLAYISSNTSSTYANISASSYELWQGNTQTLSSTDLTWDAIQDGIDEAVGKGLDEPIIIYVSIPTWGNLSADLNSLRAIDSGYSKTKTSYGTKAIEFVTTSGEVRIEPSIYMKYGYAMAHPVSEMHHGRVGSTDMTFGIPGEEEKMFRLVEGKNAVETRAYSDQAMLQRSPSKCIYWSGIVNS